MEHDSPAMGTIGNKPRTAVYAVAVNRIFRVGREAPTWYRFTRTGLRGLRGFRGCGRLVPVYAVAVAVNRMTRRLP